MKSEKIRNFFEKIIEFSKRIFYLSLSYALNAIKWIKGLSKQERKNYFLNLISCILILSVFLTTLVFPNDKGEGFDIFSSRKIVENIKNLELNMTSVIYVKNENDEWVEHKRVHGDENRIWISLDKIPKDLQNAFIAIEDEDFKRHNGVDWQRTFLAVLNQFLKFSNVDFGASTITQQLVKNITADKDKVYTRKVREIVRSIFVETQLSKDQILEAYLNTIALGNGINGVQVAANYYFSKNVDELNLAEIAAIAAITKNPSRYNPSTSMENNTARRRVVLDKMFELGYITEGEYHKAYNQDVKLDFTQKEDVDGEINDYFVDTLIQEVIDDLAEKYNCSQEIASQTFYNGGLKIYSTMKPEVQTAMETVYNNESKYFYETRKNEDGEYERVQSAMTILDYSGHIVGIVGGAGEKTVNLGLNRAYNVPRQPGSSMKPLGVYSLMIENNLADYTSIVLDAPIENYYGHGKPGPKEWFGEYMGQVPLHYALQHSMNAVPVRLLEEVGIEESYKFLTEKLNFKHIVEEDKNASSLALGGCMYGITPTESAAAFAIFGNGGMYYEPTTYYKVVDIDGNIVLENKTKGNRAIGADTATIMNHMLREVVYNEGGTARTISGYSYKMKAYAKTGTSSDTKDSWIVGGTPYYVGSVWYGFDHNQRVYNSNMAKTIWRDIMRTIHNNLEKKEFVDSEDVYKKGNGYYKDGTKPGKILAEEDYLPKDESEESLLASDAISSTDSTLTSSTDSDTKEETPLTSETESTPSNDSSQDTSTDISEGTSEDTSGEGEDPPSQDTSTDSSSSVETDNSSNTDSSSENQIPTIND